VCNVHTKEKQCRCLLFILPIWKYVWR